MYGVGLRPMEESKDNDIAELWVHSWELSSFFFISQFLNRLEYNIGLTD